MRCGKLFSCFGDVISIRKSWGHFNLYSLLLESFQSIFETSYGGEDKAVQVIEGSALVLV